MLTLKEIIKEFKNNTTASLEAVAGALLCCLMFAIMLTVCAVCTGCKVYKYTDVNGRAVIVTNDTTIVDHKGYLEFKK